VVVLAFHFPRNKYFPKITYALLFGSRRRTDSWICWSVEDPHNILAFFNLCVFKRFPRLSHLRNAVTAKSWMWSRNWPIHLPVTIAWLGLHVEGWGELELSLYGNAYPCDMETADNEQIGRNVDTSSLCREGFRFHSLTWNEPSCPEHFIHPISPYWYT
jgi:hypothetical protein